jgi:RHH-type rel operon transcriptional repressor/antitoxin RelB
MEVVMLGVRLEKELEDRLESLAQQTGRSKSYHARQAIQQYVEDREDYLIAVAALEKVEAGKDRLVPLEKLVRKYVLEDSTHGNSRKADGRTGSRRATPGARLSARKTRRAA